MNMHILIRKIKLRKLKNWDNYLSFVKEENNYIHSKEFFLLDEELDEEPIEKDLFEYLPEYIKIKEKYRIPNIESKETDFDKAVAIMQWLTDHTHYCGMQFHILPDDTLKILEFSFDKGFRGAINCRDKAIVLTDLLIAYGIKAYPILLENITKTECHFVTHVFCSEINKWVVLDPSFNCYFTDENSKILNIFELRDHKINNKTPNAVGYSFNGTDEAEKIYLKYFVGNGLAKVSTWKSNSTEGRKTKNLGKRKQFPCKIPVIK